MLNNFLKTIFLVFASLTVNLAFAKNLGPNESINACINNRGIAFEEDGHFYTTYAIAKFAGRSNTESIPLSFFSEYPDESKYTATKNSLISIIRLQKVINKNGFEKQVVEKLHSLHGGDYKAIEKRRSSLKNAISTNLKSSNNLWKAGLLIHAYGDAYAHTKGDFNKMNEEAYTYPIGHAFDSIFGTNPDKIVTTKEKYTAYTKALYAILETPDADKRKFEEFLKKINDTECKTSKCIQKIIKDESSSALMDFSICMKNQMRPLTKKEIQDVMDQIR